MTLNIVPGFCGPRTCRADPVPAEAYVLYRELDYFEQLGALEKHGGFDFELIRTLLGQRLTDRWEMWQPSIDALGGSAAYPMFEKLATKMRAQV